MHRDDSHVNQTPGVASEESSRTAPDSDARAVGAPTGAGAEAAEGIHSVNMVGTHQRSALEHRTTGRTVREGAARSGSEPIRKTWIHESGYGGKGGSPRTSSDEREPAEQDASRTQDAPRPSPGSPDPGAATTPIVVTELHE